MGAALGAMCSQHNEQVRNIGGAVAVGVASISVAVDHEEPQHVRNIGGTIPVQIRTVRLSGCETGPSGCEGIFWAPTHGLVTHATLRATRDPLHHTKHQRARPQHVPVPVPTHVRTSHPNAPRTDCTLAFCVYARLLRTRDPRRGTRARAVLSCTSCVHKDFRAWAEDSLDSPPSIMHGFLIQS